MSSLSVDDALASLLRLSRTAQLGAFDEGIKWLLGVNKLVVDILIMDKDNDFFERSVDVGLPISVWTYCALLIFPNFFYQYSFNTVLPTFIFSSQSLLHVSSFVDLTLVTDCPSARWAPAQFMQMNTPKSKEAPL